jgi:hypothetical protein
MPRNQLFWPSADSILRISALLFASSALVWGASCPAQGQTSQGAIPSAALDFGVFPVNGSSPAQSMTFVFQQTETLSLVRVGAAGIHGVEFKNLGGTCQVGSTYTQNQQCTVELAFRPTFVGDLHGYVSLSDTTGHVIATGFVHGVGGGSQLIFPPGAGQQVSNIPTQFLATDSYNNVYATRSIGTTENSAVYLIDAKGDSRELYEVPNVIRGMAIDGALDIYLLFGDSVQKIAPDGSMTNIQLLPANGTNGPDQAITADGSGNVYVTVGGTIQRIAPDGTVSIVSSDWGNEPFEVNINTLIVSNNGTFLYSLDIGNPGDEPTRGRVYQQTLGGGQPTIVYDGGESFVISSLAQQADGTLLVEGGGSVIQNGTPSIPVIPVSLGNLTIASSGDVYYATYPTYPGTSVLYKLSRSIPPGLFFAPTSEGETVDATFAMMNSGNQPLTFTAPQITGLNASSFHIQSTTCDAQTGLLPGATCTVTVSFSSSQSGQQTASWISYPSDPVYSGTPVNVLLQATNP